MHTSGKICFEVTRMKSGVRASIDFPYKTKNVPVELTDELFFRARHLDVRVVHPALSAGFHGLPLPCVRYTSTLDYMSPESLTWSFYAENMIKIGPYL